MNTEELGYVRTVYFRLSHSVSYLHEETKCPQVLFVFLHTLQTYNGVIAHRQAVVHEAYQMGRDVAENIFGTQKKTRLCFSVFHLTDTQTEQLAWRY